MYTDLNISLCDENYLTISNTTLWKNLRVNKDTRDTLKQTNITLQQAYSHIKLNGEIFQSVPLIHKQDKVVHPPSLSILSTI